MADSLIEVQEVLIEELKKALDLEKEKNLRLQFALKKAHKHLQEARMLAHKHRSVLVDPFAGPTPSQMFPWERKGF